eukprot:TRINITY_DN7555_c0_g1_i1.p1 TRINITY_DN7555_c0_g1~~TRINITY_DN7555_c0_g1_i1.p1  ORF type:complete len:286 (+),score=67.08 TRINITY_DN7555_c0_g1_i1:874-1731(+)
MAATGKAALASDRSTARPKEPVVVMKEKIQGPVMVRPQERAQNVADISPGPGAYDAIEAYNYAHPGLAKSIGGVVIDYKQGAVRGSPGPGAYNPKRLGTIPGPKIMAKTERQFQPVEKKFNIKDTGDENLQVPKKAMRPTFGKGQRGDLAPKSITPGPDAYQRIEAEWRGKDTDPDKEACTFGMKTSKFYQPNKYPGPGAYHLGWAPYDGPAFSMGGAPRVGPAAPMYTDRYYYPKDLYPGSAISFTMEPRPYEYKKSKYPGPGMYDIPDTVGIIPEYLLNGNAS